MVDIVLCPTCPVADAGEDQFTAPNSLVTLNGSNSYDPNGDIIASEWIQTSGTSVGLSDEESLITTFTAPSSNGDLTFKLHVYDNDTNEATIARSFFSDVGFNNDRIYFVENSRNTIENLRKITDLNILNKSNVLITSAFHMKRKFEFSKIV